MILLLFLLLLLPPTALGATRYVSPQGTNANACATSTSPGTSARRTLNGAQGAIACMQPGDTLVMQDGVWNEQLSDITDSEHPGTTRPPSGLSWSQPTVIRAEHPRGATLNKPGAGHPYGHVVMLGRADTQYVSLEGLVIDGRGHNTCVWIGPSSHIRLQGNVIRNCGSNGIFGTTADDKSGGTDIQLLDNEIFSVSVEAPQPPGTHGIYFTGNHSVARGNYIHAPCPHYGLQFSSELGGLYSNVIENNRIVGCDMAGIISQGSDTVIKNNLLEHNCIGIYLSHAATTVAHNTIYGYHRSANCPDSYGIFDKSYGSTLTNNVILKQAAGWSYVYAMQTPPTVQTNLCDQAGSPACGLIAPVEAVVVDGPGGNLTLKAGSPALDAGTVRVDVPTDRLGVSRPQGSGVDIGAYEDAVSTPPTGDTAPPTATLTSPTAGAQVSGTVTLTAQAADNVAVAGLQYRLDSSNIGPELYTPPYQYTWETTTTTPGPHTLSVSVRDPANNYGASAPIGVTVVTGGPLPPASATQLACVGLQGEGGGIAIACTPQPARR